jgi:RNA polymerase subunit RPABC4/transcription elongation factor Spt4
MQLSVSSGMGGKNGQSTKTDRVCFSNQLGETYFDFQIVTEPKYVKISQKTKAVLLYKF